MLEHGASLTDRGLVLPSLFTRLVGRLEFIRCETTVLVLIDAIEALGAHARLGALPLAVLVLVLFLEVGCLLLGARPMLRPLLLKEGQRFVLGDDLVVVGVHLLEVMLCSLLGLGAINFLVAILVQF